MDELGIEEQRKLLLQNGWIAIEDQLVGEGGGARVFKVLSAAVANEFVDPLLCPMDRDAARKLAPTLAEAIAKIAQHEVSAIAAGKVFKTADHRAKREIDVLQDIRHPNLIRLIEHDKSALPRWYVMPVMRHGTVQNIAPRLKGDLVSVVRGLTQISNALNALHSHDNPIVHRDIKPSNIFIGENGEWVLGDPGVAYRDDSGDETQTRAVSKDWFPRWYEDEFGHSSVVDIYMLGMVAFYLLTGQSKPLDPSYLLKPRFDLPKLFPDAFGVKEAYAMLCSIVKSDPADMAYQTGAQLTQALRELLPVVENSELHQLRNELRHFRNEPRLIFNYAAVGDNQIDAVSLQRAAVWIPSNSDVLVIWIASKHDMTFQLDIVDLSNRNILATSPQLKNNHPNIIKVPAELQGSWQNICLRGSGTPNVGTGRIVRLSVYASAEAPVLPEPG